MASACASSTCHQVSAPETLAKALPGCEKLEAIGPNEYKATMKVGVAAIKGTFDGKVKLPENYFAKIAPLPIKYGLGHPVDKHPVKDQMDPTDNSKVRVALNCATCHQPHASAQANLLVNDQANNLMFCAGCHKDLGK